MIVGISWANRKLRMNGWNKKITGWSTLDFTETDTNTDMSRAQDQRAGSGEGERERGGVTTDSKKGTHPNKH